MSAFFLNRIIVPKTPQMPVFQSNASEEEVLRKVIGEKPSLEIRRGQVWHIGNVEQIDNKSLIFAVGRTAKSTIARLDETSGDFVEERSDIAPFTSVVIDFEYQLLAVAHLSILAPTPAALASKIQQIINQSPILQEAGRSCEILTISDPDDFIATINSAFRIFALTVEFGRPNPWDAEEQFQKPMQNLLRDSDAKEGKTIIKGDDLKKEVVRKIARATSAAGRDAKLRYQRRRRGRSAIKHLKGDTAKVQADGLETHESKLNLINLVRELYTSIRNEKTERSK